MIFDDSEPPTRGERTRARLREGARSAFAELGWPGTRVEDIVQRAGTSHGTFYTYYDNKSAVLADLVHGSQTEFVALATAPWEESDDVRVALIDVQEAADHPLERAAHVVGLLPWSRGQRHELGLATVHEVRQDRRLVVVVGIEGAVARARPLHDVLDPRAGPTELGEG